MAKRKAPVKSKVRKSKPTMPPIRDTDAQEVISRAAREVLKPNGTVQYPRDFSAIRAQYGIYSMADLLHRFALLRTNSMNAGLAKEGERLRVSVLQELHSPTPIRVAVSKIDYGVKLVTEALQKLLVMARTNTAFMQATAAPEPETVMTTIKPGTPPVSMPWALHFVLRSMLQMVRHDPLLCSLFKSHGEKANREFHYHGRESALNMLDIAESLLDIKYDGDHAPLALSIVRSNLKNVRTLLEHKRYRHVQRLMIVDLLRSARFTWAAFLDQTLSETE